MKNVLYILVFALILLACQKEEVPPTTTEVVESPKVIQWKWQVPIRYEWLSYMRTSAIVGDEIILSYYNSHGSAAAIPNLMAYNKYTGQLVWQYDHPGVDKIDFRYCFASGDKLILRYVDRWVCISAKSRAVIWEKKHSDHYSYKNAATIDGDYLYTEEKYYFNPADFPFNDSSFLIRIHIPTGKKQKIYREGLKPGIFGNPSIYLPVIYKEGGREIAIFYRRIDDPSDNANDLIAIDIQTKEILWRHRNFSERVGPYLTPPVIYNGHVILGHGSSVYCYHATTGQMIWKKELYRENERVSFGLGGPFMYDDKLYLFEYEGFGFCLNPDTGWKFWETIRKDYRSMPSYDPGFQPVAKDDVILVTSATMGNLVVYDLKNNGELLQNTKEAKFNDTNVLYDADTDQFYVAGDDKLLAFTIKK